MNLVDKYAEEIANLKYNFKQISENFEYIYKKDLKSKLQQFAKEIEKQQFDRRRESGEVVLNNREWNKLQKDIEST